MNQDAIAIFDAKEKFVFKMDADPYYAPNPYVAENGFLTQQTEDAPLPRYDDIRERLPQPVWDGHEDAINCYDWTWKTAFGNLRPANSQSRFVSNYIDCAFSDFSFMWDSAFIVMFGKYANHIFNFQKTLDNFYSHQHRDGFISRQLFQHTEGARYSRDDPSSTGPNILPWAEWEYYCTTKDVERLKKVFAPLCGYHKWLQLNRTWQNGGYWSNGLACGMDNQPRLAPGYDVIVSHGFMTWIDTCAQQYLSAEILVKIAEILGREADVAWLQEERDFLKKLINGQMWDEKTAFYYDMLRDGKLTTTKSIGAYWTMLAGICPEEWSESFVAHLDNEAEFKRTFRIPSLSADHPEYDEKGDYWRGGVWAPTNYMVLKALDRYGYQTLAYEIACNYVENVVKIFDREGTIYENYSSEHLCKGDPARRDFVGWTGLAPITILFEYVFGIRPDAANKKIVWHVNCLERHGVCQYPLGDQLIDLICEARNSAEEEPRITVRGDVTVEVIWNGKRMLLQGE